MDRNNNNAGEASATSLRGLRVLDLSRVLAGPSCAQMLADLGADVIKIERPERGDDSRAWGPPFMPDTAGNDTAESAYFCSCNRGKRSITLDLASHAGQDIMRRLVLRSDVLVENYKVGTLSKYGLGYADVAAINPRLIYCSVTGFGQTGPYRTRPGYDTIAQAMGGLMSVTGQGRDHGDPQPLKAGVPVTDIMTGLYATIGILAALQSRATTGLGQQIDIALLDVQVAGLANLATNYLATGRVPEPLGNRLPTLYPSDSFRCLDGHIMLIIGNDEQFRRFCEAAGLSGMAADPRFLTNQLRIRNAAILGPVMESRLQEDTVQSWVLRLEKFGIACAPINNVAQVFDNEQIRARGMVIETPHPSAGMVRTVANPLRLSGTPIHYHRPPPTLGQHSVEVLRELAGLSDQEIGRLRADGVV